MSARIPYSFAHLERLSNEHGIFEHAEGTRRRVEHGLCTDDNARLLVVASRERDTGPARRLGRLALDFVLGGQDADGRSRNRMDACGQWTDEAGTEDCWGRGLWALGTAAALIHAEALETAIFLSFACKESLSTPGKETFMEPGRRSVGWPLR